MQLKSILGAMYMVSLTQRRWVGGSILINFLQVQTVLCGRKCSYVAVINFTRGWTDLRDMNGSYVAGINFVQV